MTIRRVVPDIVSERIDESRDARGESVRTKALAGGSGGGARGAEEGRVNRVGTSDSQEFGLKARRSSFQS
jgi:hypothetical protein